MHLRVNLAPHPKPNLHDLHLYLLIFRSIKKKAAGGGAGNPSDESLNTPSLSK